MSQRKILTDGRTSSTIIRTDKNYVSHVCRDGRIRDCPRDYDSATWRCRQCKCVVWTEEMDADHEVPEESRDS